MTWQYQEFEKFCSSYPCLKRSFYSRNESTTSWYLFTTFWIVTIKDFKDTNAVICSSSRITPCLYCIQVGTSSLSFTFPVVSSSSSLSADRAPRSRRSHGRGKITFAISKCHLRVTKVWDINNGVLWKLPCGCSPCWCCSEPVKATMSDEKLVGGDFFSLARKGI